jgi:hypothetical protein
MEAKARFAIKSIIEKTVDIFFAVIRMAKDDEKILQPLGIVYFQNKMAAALASFTSRIKWPLLSVLARSSPYSVRIVTVASANGAPVWTSSICPEKIARDLFGNENCACALAAVASRKMIIASGKIVRELENIAIPRKKYL